jgi:uncharacterized protein with FMN-binding domain
MKKISIITTITFLLIFSGLSSLFAQYNAGEYTGSAYGRIDKKHNGEIEVKVTVSADKIEKIEVTKYEQSVDHKKYGDLVAEAKTKVPAGILEKQALGVDVVTDATMASNAIELAVAKALDKASTKKYVPGTYKGSAYGRSDKKHNGLIEVEVTVSENKIDDIKVMSYEQSIDHKKYGKPVIEAKTKVPAQIKEKQSLEVDIITDATFAGNAINLAVAKALQQARAK